MKLGEKLKHLRESRGYMQRDVANDLGIAPNTLSGYERNVRNPDSETLKALAVYYGVTVDDLLGTLSIKELEAEMPEGATVLRRMKNMPPSAQKRMLSIINAVLDEEEKALRERNNRYKQEKDK